MDLTTTDENGMPWDFSKIEQRNKAMRRWHEERPLFIIGTPMCTAFSILQQWNSPKMDPQAVADKMKDARMHFEFCMNVYRVQTQAGRYFIHEHPQSATSWKEPSVQRMSKEEGVIKVDVDMCALGLKTEDKGKVGYAKKATTIMTNSPYVLSLIHISEPTRP